jgi:hypothetical protein
MSEEIEVVESKMYYYYGPNGEKLYTPNSEFAAAQASKYETHDVYAEKA